MSSGENLSSNEPQSFFVPIFEAIEYEADLWRVLHDRLTQLVGEQPTPEIHPDEYTTAEVPLNRFWKLLIRHLDLEHPDSNNERYVNKWDIVLTLPIEVSLWVNDGKEYNYSIDDNPKHTAICSPRGVIDKETKKHLTPEQIQGLINDLEQK